MLDFRRDGSNYIANKGVAKLGMGPPYRMLPRTVTNLLYIEQVFRLLG